MDKSAQRYIDLAFEYHVAAMALNSQIFDAPYLYNPTAYLLRHTIELLLKGLIINEKKRKNHISIKEIKVGKKNINAQHSLLSLWAHLNKLASPAFEKSDIALIRSVITKIDKKDFSSTRYRYPYKGSKDKPIKQIPLEPVAISITDLVPDLSEGIPWIAIHNHIYYNSTAYDRSRKFRNFIGSSFALRRLSDRVCLEHNLSVIVNPKLHSKGRYLHYGQWLGENQKLSQKEQIRFAIDAALTERPVDFADFLRRMETAGIQVKHGRGGVISFLVPGQQRAARFRAATLGDGYGPEDVQAVIDGKAPTRTAPVRRAPAPRRVNLLIDIQERMRQGKGPAYERWAKVYNLKQMAAALQYLKEHQLFEYDDLAAKTDAATERFHTLAGDIQQTEAELSRVSDLMAAVVQYAKTRPAFDGYKAAKYSRKYLAEHEAELADYRAAKAAMAELLGGEKLPKMDVLKEKRRQLAARKKALYLEYRKAQQDMRELVAVKGSVDHLRGLTDNQRNKEQAR